MSTNGQTCDELWLKLLLKRVQLLCTWDDFKRWFICTMFWYSWCPAIHCNNHDDNNSIYKGNKNFSLSIAKPICVLDYITRYPNMEMGFLWTRLEIKIKLWIWIIIELFLLRWCYSFYNLYDFQTNHKIVQDSQILRSHLSINSLYISSNWIIKFWNSTSD